MTKAWHERPRAWAWNLIAPPGVRRQAWRDGYCAGLLLGEGYWNQRPAPWHHRDLRAWQAGLRDGAELAARHGPKLHGAAVLKGIHD